ncbi:MAG: response regulator [Lachnospiraceae bacterium]
MKPRNDSAALYKHYYLLTIVIFFFSVVFFLLYPNYAFATQKTVRVGWFYQENIQEGSLPGKLHGYNYEYLQKIALYTGWSYEFVFADWDKCEQMLADGEIDLLGYVSKTESRIVRYSFSSTESGRVNLYLVSADHDAPYITGDFSELQGATIATISSGFRTAFLDSIAQKHGVHINYKIYNTQQDCYQALDNGQVDYAYVSDIGNNSDYRTVLQLPEQPFYFAINSKRDDLRTQLDDAMTSIMASNGDFNNELEKKYVSDSKSRNPVAYTRSEQKYIDTCSIIRVAISQNNYPMAYQDDYGTHQGFLFDFLDLLSEESGLRFRLIYYKDYSTALTAVKDGMADITLQLPNNYSFAHNRNMILSQPFITIQHGLIHKKANSVKTIGVQNGQFVDPALSGNTDYELSFYKSIEECMSDIESEKVDSALVNIYLYQRLVQQYTDSNYQFEPLAYGNISYCIGINQDCNPQLIYILDKTIGNISEDKAMAMLAASSSVAPKTSFSQWIHNNRFLLLSLLVVLVGIIFYFVFFFQRQLTNLEKKANLALSEKNRELEKANAAKSDFLSRTSHDLRTPMNAIIGLTALAMDDDSVMKKDMYLSQIANSSELLLGLINDVLDMDKIENGAIELHPQPYSYAEFTQLIRNMITPLCRKKNIDFIFEEIPHGRSILVDRVRFNQIFFNLLSNAVKFTPQNGTIVFDVNAGAVHDNEVELDFLIADTGIGMSDEFMAHMYEPFSQEERPASSQAIGSGLGLAIVKSMVDLMGGTIDVQSHLDEGTIFLVHLTAPVVTESVTASSAIDIEKLNAVLRNKRILLTDDQPLNLEVAKKILEKKEIQVTIASDGSEALKIFSQSDIGYFDAILMDIRMPKMNGLEATKSIRALFREDAKRIPIIAMTANTLDEDRNEATAAGMNAHLGKPIVPKELFECLYEWLN